jgi:hypothetical protein
VRAAPEVPTVKLAVKQQEWWHGLSRPPRAFPLVNNMRARFGAALGQASARAAHTNDRSWRTHDEAFQIIRAGGGSFGRCASRSGEHRASRARCLRSGTPRALSALYGRDEAQSSARTGEALVKQLTSPLLPRLRRNQGTSDMEQWLHRLISERAYHLWNRDGRREGAGGALLAFSGARGLGGNQLARLHAKCFGQLTSAATQAREGYRAAKKKPQTG